LILATPASPGMNNDVYEELSRLNNEVINRERELARKSASLERLSAEKSRLLAIAAHDLRNPLTVIASYADLLRTDDLSREEERLFIDEISQSARFMTELVEELLDSARLESGHVDVDLQEIDLVNAAAHASTINRMRADRKQITLTFEPLTDRAPIRADPVKLRQIINNLVVNAIKFSRSNTNVTIRVRRENDRAVVEIEDQGIGIPRDKLAAIFEPFSTLGASGTGGEKSTGLGLAIVKQLTHLHHAAIDVESDEGRGTVFRVAFPLSGTN
jgi:two-component system, OmpR family, sensor kinase